MIRKTKWNGGENDIHRLWNVNLYAFSLFTSPSSSSSVFYGKVSSSWSHGIASIYWTRCIATSDKMDHFYLTKYPDVGSIFSPWFLPIQKKWNESEKKILFRFQLTQYLSFDVFPPIRVHSFFLRFCQLDFVWFVCVMANTYTHKHATNTATPINQVLSCATKLFVLICMAQFCWYFTLNWELRKWKFQTSSFPHNPRAKRKIKK